MLMHNWAGTSFGLLPQKAVWMPESKCLLIADLHYAKIGHFRKNGIALPHEPAAADLAVLDDLIALLQPEVLLFMGDIFHSSYNRELEYFAGWRRGYSTLDFRLISGNHDVLDASVYDALSIKLLGDKWIQGNLLFTHYPRDKTESDSTGIYRVCGHVHPAVKLKGRRPQNLRLPCFYFGHTQLILPAFGNFTGTHSITPSKDEKVFVIAAEKVIAV